MVRMGEKRDVGIANEEPAVRMTAAVSPILLPTLNRMPVKIPGKALGSTTRVVVCHLVPPRD
jgi:hypothetical protein